MTNFEVIKYETHKTEGAAVHQCDNFTECEDFVHTAIVQSENTEALYCINRNEVIHAAYRNVEGQIVCKGFGTSRAA